MMVGEPLQESIYRCVVNLVLGLVNLEDVDILHYLVAADGKRYDQLYAFFLAEIDEQVSSANAKSAAAMEIDKNYRYDGNDLGATYSPESTTPTCFNTGSKSGVDLRAFLAPSTTAFITSVTSSVSLASEAPS